MKPLLKHALKHSCSRELAIPRGLQVRDPGAERHRGGKAEREEEEESRNGAVDAPKREAAARNQRCDGKKEEDAHGIVEEQGSDVAENERGNAQSKAPQEAKFDGLHQATRNSRLNESRGREFAFRRGHS